MNFAQNIFGVAVTCLLGTSAPTYPGSAILVDPWDRLYAFEDIDDNAVVIETIKRLPQIELIAGGGVDVAALRSLRQIDLCQRVSYRECGRTNRKVNRVRIRELVRLWERIDENGLVN